MVDLLLLIHDKDSSAGTTTEWCQSRGLSFSVQVAENFLEAHTEPEGCFSEFKGLIVFGGDMQVWETEKHPWLAREKSLIRQSIEQGKPVLGLCLGGQLVAEQTGGVVKPSEDGWDIGWRKMNVLTSSKTSKNPTVLSWHRSRFEPSHACEVTVLNRKDQPEAIRVSEKVFGFQFHLEIDEQRLSHALRGYDPKAESHVQTLEQLISGFREHKEELKSCYFEILDEWWAPS